MTDKLIIFDTTLRDGEQSPGASMTRSEKMRIAKALEKLRVDVIEAGFPIASGGDFEAVRSVAEIIKNSTVCGLARTGYQDIDAAAEALKPARSARIHTFIATSPIHMERKLMMQPDEVVEAAVKAVKRAKKYTDDVEFSPEDAGRSELDFLCRIIEAVIAAGATTVNIPDTVGYSIPTQFGGNYRQYYRAGAQFRQGGVFGTLPQRPGSCRGQFPGRGHARRQAGGVHHQWAGRARGECLPGRDCHGSEDTQGLFPLQHRAGYDRDRELLKTGIERDGFPGTTEQGRGRRQCLCPRSRHSPGWRDQESGDLRDHACPGRRLVNQPPGSG